MTKEKGRNLGGSNFNKTDPLHKDYWATPQEIVDGLLRYAVVKEIVPEGLPLLDVCASEQNKKCERFITEQQDTLVTPWGEGNLCWLNPPYSNVHPFLNKAFAGEGSWIIQYEDNSQAPFVLSDKKFRERFKESAQWVN